MKNAKTKIAHDFNGNSKIVVLGSRKEFDKNFEIVKIYNTAGVSTEMVIPKQK